MQENQVLAFLEKYPEFLQEHAARFGLRPSLERVISLSERQLLESRDKYRRLEQDLKILINNASTNDLIQKNLQRLTLLFLQAEKSDILIHDLQQALEKIFLLKNAVLRLWHHLAEDSPYYQKSSVDIMRFIQSQDKKPFTTQYINDELLSWLPDSPVMQSFALLPLLDARENCFGLLILASEDHERFSPQKNNNYLLYLSEQLALVIDCLLIKEKANK